MTTTTVPDALAAWRLAERRWEDARVDDPAFRALGIEVVSTWLRYHELIDREPGSFVLVADDDHAYVAVSDGVMAVLGYEPGDVIGRRIEDISPPDLVPGTTDAWSGSWRTGARMAAIASCPETDGRWRCDSSASTSPDPGVPYVAALARPAGAVSGPSTPSGQRAIAKQSEPSPVPFLNIGRLASGALRRRSPLTA